MNLETTIDNYLFRLMSDGTVEISYKSDKSKDPIHRFVLSGDYDQVKFEKECAWWYMENSSKLAY